MSASAIRTRPKPWRTGLLSLAVVASSLPLVACAPMTQQMTPAQRDAVELRRFCERNPNAETECLGFHGRG